MKSLIWRTAQGCRKIYRRIKRVVGVLKLKTLKRKRVINIEKKEARDYIESYRVKNDVISPSVKRERTVMLSVIIPVYNAEHYIVDCIKSIISQDISYSYEIVCVNDGSKDNSLEALQSIKNDKIKIISQENAGAGAARNRGLDAASGEYIMFVDADDKLIDGSINKMLKAAQDNGADITFGTVAKANFDMSSIYYPKIKKDKITENLLRACSLSEGTPWGKCYKYSLWEDIRFSENYAYEDTIIFLNLYAKAKKFAMLGTPVYCFRSSQNSLYKRENASKRSVDMVWVVLQSLKQHLMSNGELTARYYELILWHLSVITYKRINNLQDKKLIENCFAYISGEIKYLYVSNPITLDFEGKNSFIFKKVHQSFIENDYLLYVACCNVLSGQGLI